MWVKSVSQRMFLLVHRAGLVHRICSVPVYCVHTQVSQQKGEQQQQQIRAPLRATLERHSPHGHTSSIAVGQTSPPLSHFAIARVYRHEPSHDALPSTYSVLSFGSFESHGGIGPDSWLSAIDLWQHA